MGAKPITFFDEEHVKKREYSRKRWADPEAKARDKAAKKKRMLENPDKYKQKAKQYRESYEIKHPGKQRDAKYAYRKRNPEKNRAAVYAFRHVPLKSYCEVCGGTNDLQKHHPDYSRPLEVVTLCIKCHDVADKIRQLTAVQRAIILANRHCETCGLTYPNCGKSRPLLEGSYGCSMWVEKPFDLTQQSQENKK
jgi:hypothetical protein